MTTMQYWVMFCHILEEEFNRLGLSQSSRPPCPIIPNFWRQTKLAFEYFIQLIHQNFFIHRFVFTEIVKFNCGMNNKRLMGDEVKVIVVCFSEPAEEKVAVCDSNDEQTSLKSTNGKCEDDVQQRTLNESDDSNEDDVTDETTGKRKHIKNSM